MADDDVGLPTTETLTPKVLAAVDLEHDLRGRNLRGCTITGDLSGRDLSGADLSILIARS